MFSGTVSQRHGSERRESYEQLRGLCFLLKWNAMPENQYKVDLKIDKKLFNR